MSNISGKGDALLTITATANTTIKSRIDTIFVSNSFGVQNIIIKQIGGATEVSELSSVDILFYPNPVLEKGYINLPNSMLHGRIELYSLNGKLLNSQIAESNIVEIDMNKFVSGIYIIKIITPHEVLTTNIEKQ